MTTKTVEELKGMETGLVKAIQDAAMSGDMERVAKLVKEREQVAKDIRLALLEETKAEREEYAALLLEAIEQIDWSHLPASLYIQFNGLDGDNPARTVSINVEGLLEYVKTVVGDVVDQRPDSVKGFTYSGGELRLSTGGNTPRAPRSNSGGGARGRGWTKDGETLQLQEVIGREATPGELAAIESKRGNSDGGYSAKVKVAKAHGWVMAG